MTTFLDAREVPEATRIVADLCIVGAGAAGITLARSLAPDRISVCLLEGGGLDYEPESQALYAGDMLGQDDHPLDVSRLRYFGGSTNHWNGHIRLLGRDDFEQRDWMAHSGWPISRADLDAYYPEAAQVVQIMGRYRWRPEGLEENLQRIFLEPSLRENERLATSIFHHSPPTRFGEVYRSELAAAPHIDVYLHANVTGFETSEDGRHVSAVQVRTLSGRSFEVAARFFVLATGGIENARLLLAAHRQNPAFGDPRGLVGRFFLDHPIGVVAQMRLSEPSGLFWVPGSPTGTGALIGLSEETRRREQLPRMVCRFKPVYPPTHGRDRRSYFAGHRLFDNLKKFFSTGEAPERFSDDLMTVLADLDGLWRYREHLRLDHPVDSVLLEGTLEQLPNPDSRIWLGDDLDPLGMPRVQLHWRFTDDDARGWWRSIEILGQELAALGIGRLKAEDWVLAADPQQFGAESSYHHSGTTRMSEDPSRGVVDGSGRMHHVENLYIAGSSVFPTIGDANPTLTIVALVLRLADHLRERFQAA